MATEDELRAEQYQRDHAAMHARRQALAAKLHGNPAARHQLAVDWSPLEQWLRERQQSPVPVEDD